MEFTYFIDTDVSKTNWILQLCMVKPYYSKENSQSHADFIKELIELPGFSLSNALFCMEHTGIYNNHLLAILYKKKTNIWLEAAIQIKNSSGKLRGKNNSIIIADYAYTKKKRTK